ncbi:FAD dependent oxidoreductase [Colletotrichum karsti]|uniref:FAD dependent oxidoreductase n=1 Tax=Colletotrichum karsti TaxID=1095194 RepID=A0A9P6ICT1_9PEZI|nr:FAD dependent oxidoreductase [Colletotrichum karsti]KAF9876280.1 FAD dependent oxidoreductase [Colletotrichum karsti]
MAVKSRLPIFIVGAGVFGAAGALTAIIKHPDSEVVLIDPSHLPHPRSASYDVSKIIRDDYGQTLHIHMARSAMNVWLDADSLYSKFFHRVGMLRCQPDDFNEKSLAAYKKAGIPTKSRWVDVAEVSPVLAGADFGGMDKVMYNPDYGYVDAEACLAAVRQEAVDRGVKLLVGEVTSLTFDDAGDCTGVRLQTEGASQELRGKVLLCTGARTAALLRDSAPERTELHAGNRLKATGAMSFTVRIDGELKERFDAGPVPVFKNRVEEVMGELVSYKNGLLKFNRDGCWTLNKDEPWVAPNEPGLTEWVTDPKAIPDSIKQLARQTIVGLCGKDLADCEIEEYRFCWDAYTPNHDFIISKHPHSQNLYVATGGTFHGWKFLPVLGDYIVKMLDNELEPKYRQLWDWDRVHDEDANTTYPILGALSEQ